MSASASKPATVSVKLRRSVAVSTVSVVTAGACELQTGAPVTVEQKFPPSQRSSVVLQAPPAATAPGMVASAEALFPLPSNSVTRRPTAAENSARPDSSLNRVAKGLAGAMMSLSMVPIASPCALSAMYSMPVRFESESATFSVRETVSSEVRFAVRSKMKGTSLMQKFESQVALVSQASMVASSAQSPPMATRSGRASVTSALVLPAASATLMATVEPFGIPTSERVTATSKEPSRAT